jgi:hypothetical protein
VSVVVVVVLVVLVSVEVVVVSVVVVGVVSVVLVVTVTVVVDDVTVLVDDDVTVVLDDEVAVVEDEDVTLVVEVLVPLVLVVVLVLVVDDAVDVVPPVVVVVVVEVVVVGAPGAARIVDGRHRVRVGGGRRRSRRLPSSFSTATRRGRIGSAIADRFLSTQQVSAVSGSRIPAPSTSTGTHSRTGRSRRLRRVSNWSARVASWVAGCAPRGWRAR